MERANALMECVPLGAIEVAGSAGTQDLEEESAELLQLKAVSGIRSDQAC